MKSKTSKGKPTRGGHKALASPDDEQKIWLHFLGTDVMAEYLDATGKIREALDKGEKEVALPTEFLAKWIPQTIRMEDQEVVEAWNQSCDAAGFPDKKRPLPEPPPDPMVLNEGVDVGHAIRYKENPDEEGGPF